MGFKEHKQLKLSTVSQEILSYWEEEAIFEKSITSREGKTPFVFFEGPPSANGMPGIHHVMARAIKDIFCRYKTQKGFQVKRKAGWDTHGLPVELGVEKELGITKDAIGKTISIDEYNEACKSAVMRYTDVWNRLTKEMGYWVDMEDPYITYKSKYIESVWWLLKQIYEKDLLYKGYTIQPYSPKAGTGLSSHELNQPGTYQDVTDTTITAQFKTIKESLPAALQAEADLYILAWTTTPWTLPSNTALTVGKKINYVVIETFNQYTHLPIRVLLAEALVGKQFSGKYIAVESEEDLKSYTSKDKKIPYRIINQILGSDLVGVRYEQLWKDAPLPLTNPEDAFRVISGDFVTTEDGTGIVHTAPTFGADDAQVAKEAIPPVPPLLVLDAYGNEHPLVTLEGKFHEVLGSLGGKYVKNEYYPEGTAPERSVDVEIAIQLKEENSAFKVEKYVHSYPNCWRTDKPILYYPLDSWFVKVSSERDRMVELNKEINWKPKSTGDGRFGNWLANANDWNLSRSRFWGIPLPIWRTEDGQETILIGSMEELVKEIEKAISAGIMTENPFSDFEVGNMSEQNYDLIDLHKNTVDKVILSSASGKPMKREADLIDVWFDSGSMPYAQWHYPFENKKKIDNNETFPADYIAEGVDQTRGWFYTLHAIGTLVFDSVAYKNVVSNGLVLDKKGQKMSKRLGNAADPFETLKTYGADATRWYMISNANPWDNLKFDLDGIAEVSRKFFGTLQNTYAFFSLYANIDKFTFKEDSIPVLQRTEMDQWILSELNKLIATVDEAYNDYEPTKATRAISEFVQEILSNWYVRLSRRRFWKGEYQEDKISAYQTLFECLLTVSKLMAPVAPFYADRLYLDLCNATGYEKEQSVHLADFPKAQSEHRNQVMEERMEKARTIASLALSLRKKEQIKVRQPLQKVMIPVRNSSEKEAIKAVEELILSEINVKELELLDDASDILVKEIKPNFKTLGPRFGKNMRFVVAEIQKLDENQLKALESEQTIEILVEGEKVTLSNTDLDIQSKDIEGWLVANNNGITVALDIQLNEELIEEGIARELINRIQNLRKDAGFEVTDKIILYLTPHKALNDALKNNLQYIKTETLTEEIHIQDELENGVLVEFDNVKTSILIKQH
ncbi:isoleucine--tRNA ligase [Flavobacteriaceae bacterium]|uniref:isoleucine--tRNA ligase n=1 Tax=Candidatus Arcticimaribacter forsetii TaxID=2820661 RepID=UPI0020771226|nr:isoleucine--tRNA ligase [Candidatus Arcticimaribacter forsetii]MDA8698532.1 isoleucine--tRNA ligase [Flavobacteriaceae bacterium]MDB2325773.1 isoleucine--tRNA ligase [Flavobacteriaceae bacterium]MDB2329118.1 isoleucine--tRNA ligase [Flavobacteriaceae bacterium]MDB4716714.1 isoleucine--tRNA ligase [Flavobacteriaceae bacterium]